MFISEVFFDEIVLQLTESQKKKEKEGAIFSRLPYCPLYFMNINVFLNMYCT